MREQVKAKTIKEPNDFIVYNIGRLYGLLNQYFSLIYKGYGLNPAQFNLLMVVKHAGKQKGIPQSEISDKLYVTAANITKLVDAVGKKGLVKRKLLPADRRVKLIRTTEKGEALLDKMWGYHVDAVNSLLKELTQKDKQKFNIFLESFIKEVNVKIKTSGK